MKNTIAQLHQILVKPKKWTAKMTYLGEYVLYFCHLDTDDWQYFCPVQNARGKTKLYKTLPALLKDVRVIDPQASVQVDVSPNKFYVV